MEVKKNPALQNNVLKWQIKVVVECINIPRNSYQS